jgi:long-chain acyl-CoA synthetase
VLRIDEQIGTTAAMTLLQTELLAYLADEFPDAVGWTDLSDGSELTIGDWNTGSNRLAHGLMAQGLIPGQRVALAMTEKEPLPWLISYMAVHKAGGVAVPLNTRLGGPELARILEHAGPRMLLASDEVLAAHPAIVTGIDLVATTTGTVGTSTLHWLDLFTSETANPTHRVAPDDVADIMYTSGTTGEPKGVMVRHGGLSSTDRIPPTWLGLGFITSSPFSTTSGSLLICGPARGGLSGWFLPAFDPARWMHAVATARPVVAFLVPAMVQLLVAHPDFEKADLSSLAVVNIGSAPIAAATLRRFGERLPAADVLCGYGMTEFGAVTAMPMGDGGRHIGSVGKPLPGVRLRVVDSEGSERSIGETGEILIAGDRPRRGYLDDLGATSTTWVDGWLHSGDLGSVDADGFLRIVGRKKEMIIRGGHNIVPGEVEAAFLEHPDVDDVAVAGVGHEVLGEDVAAWIVVTKGSTATIDDFRVFLLERLGDYKVPRRITVVDALPRNEAGKVVKARLVADDEERSWP